MLDNTVLDKERTPLMYVWDDRVLYMGKTLPRQHHQCPVDTLVVSLNEKNKNVLWPASFMHNISFAEQAFSILWLDHINQDSEHLKKEMCKNTHGYYTNLKHATNTNAIYRKIYNTRPDAKKTYSLLNKVINPNNTELKTHLESKQEPRIKKAISILKEYPQNDYSASDLAKMVHLSESRLQHLFKAATNTSLGRYKIWLKLVEAIKSLSKNRTFTDAALDGGFTDAAHFSNAFKMLSGATPSDFFIQPGKFDLFVDN